MHYSAAGKKLLIETCPYFACRAHVDQCVCLKPCHHRILEPRIQSAAKQSACWYPKSCPCTGSWSCEVLLQVRCPDLLAKPPSSESHPLVSQSARMKINQPPAETSLFIVLLSPLLLCHTLLHPFHTLPRVVLNITGRRQKPWLEGVPSFHLSGKLPSKPAAPTDTAAPKRKGKSGSWIHSSRDAVRTRRFTLDYFGDTRKSPVNTLKHAVVQAA